MRLRVPLAYMFASSPAIASMTVRVIGYLSAILPSWSGRAGADPLERIDSMLRDFDKLGTDRQEEVARDLAQLWDAFVEHFNGIEGFFNGNEERRKDYMQRVETAARRMSNAKGSEKGHYFFATALLAHYLRTLSEGAAGNSEQRMANRIVTMIERGRELLPPKPNGEVGNVH
jgi:hypothetical protein